MIEDLQSDVPTFPGCPKPWRGAPPNLWSQVLWKPPKSRSDGTRGQVVAARPRIQSAKFLEVASEAIDNIPPWDTWICFLEQYLVSWVPPQLRDLANDGIDANPEQCILWSPDGLA
jgi:hypothetical protein